MASIWTSPSGSHRIQFLDPIDSTRKAIYVGNISVKAAKEIKTRVEYLVAAKAANLAVDAETARWLKDVGEDLHAKLLAVGLVGARAKSQADASRATIADFTANYITGRTDIKPRTRMGQEQARTHLVSFFGSEILLKDFTPADADRWVVNLKTKYAEATVATNVKKARQFFRAAVRGKLIASNPFEGVKGGRMQNSTRHFFVTVDSTTKIIDKCPSFEWKAIVALCRFGGLRCPSELLALTWDDFLWDQNRFRVFSPKMAKTDKAERYVPLFPELREHVEKLFDAAEPGTKHVINKSRDPETNWRTTFAKIVRRAGLKIWERPFQNLRSSRETELVERFPVHVVTYWLGNSPTIATKHYLQVRDTDFETASQPLVNASSHRTTHRTTHSRAIPRDTDSPDDSEVDQKTLEFPEKMTLSDDQSELVGIGSDGERYPREESNLIYDLRRVACFRHTPRIHSGRRGS